MVKCEIQKKNRNFPKMSRFNKHSYMFRPSYGSADLDAIVTLQQFLIDTFSPILQ